MNPTKKSPVTIDDVAVHVGVSASTVSQALSGKGRISQATRERILLAVEELSYQPDEMAQSLARRSASQWPDKPQTKPRSRRRGRMPSSALFELMDTGELENLVRMELQQREEEGYAVEELRRDFDSQSRWTKRRLQIFYGHLMETPDLPGYPYDEPASLEGIRAARPAGPRTHRLVLSADSLYDSIHGAWLGRCVGCVLGKPIEAGWPKSKVIQYLKMADAYPLNDYIPRILPLPTGFELNPESDGFFLSEIQGVPYDDDTDYTVLGLHILESHGLDFTTADVATEWLGHLPYYRVYTAERIAYRNLTMGIEPPATALTLNPERELIGARIRVDVFGYVAPGMPELAASLAYQDAVLSHTKNGVYAAMFMAAMIAWSFISSDAEELIEVALSEIPARCRLAEAVREALTLWREDGDWESNYEVLMLKYGSYSPVHAINNTLWVVLALLHAQRDLEKAICTAVTCGLDTDCNGANIGSVMGIIHGARGIPARWTTPLQDTLHTTVAQWKEQRISVLARRTTSIAAKTLLAC